MRLATVLCAALAGLLIGCGGEEEDPPELGNEAAERAWACLEDEGYDVLGGRSDENDRDAPDVELTFSPTAEQVIFVAYYATVAEAARREPELRRNVERFDGSVVRQGSIAILTAGHADADDRAAVSDCVF